MTSLTPIPPRQKATPEPDDPERIAAILAMPCCICHEWGYTQQTRTTVHHCIMGRSGFTKVAKGKKGRVRKRAPDSMGIPLCDGHHQARFDTSKIAIHREPDLWREEYGEDTDWISWVDERLGELI